MWKKNAVYLFLFLVGGLSSYIWFNKTSISDEPEPSSASSFLPVSYARSLPSNLSDIAEQAVKSVVNIASIRITRYQNYSPFFNDPFFQQFFGEANPFGVPRERREQSLGSGVIVSSEGHILTNNHVVANASKVMVRLNDQTELEAEVVGNDPQTDLALIKIALPPNLAPLPMGDSDRLRLAESVLAIGSPFGLGGTVTSGIVSAKGRANVGIVDYEDFIQTDAAINPGNSGGALINLSGELVAINTAIYSRSGGYQGIGFAIPINMAKYVMEQLIKQGRVERGWIGIRYQDINSDIAKALNLSRNLGVIITGVFESSPAQDAKLSEGDVLTEFNGTAIQNTGHLSRLLSETPIGQKITLSVQRGKDLRSVRVEMRALPKQVQNTRQQTQRR